MMFFGETRNNFNWNFFFAFRSFIAFKKMFVHTNIANEIRDKTFFRNYVAEFFKVNFEYI